MPETESKVTSSFARGCPAPVQAAANGIHGESVSHPFDNPDNGKHCELIMTPLYFEGQPLRFVEHVYDYANNRQTRQVLAGFRQSRNVVLVSDDLGNSWTQSHEFSFSVGQIFSTASGSRLLWDDAEGRLRCLNSQWQEKPVSCPARFPWHGAQGVGQNANTIMFAEYWTDGSVPEGHVWRSTDDGETWSAAFSVPSHGSTSPKSVRVRHFHTLQPDPYHPGHWYLSSGDDTAECRLWLTKDDGATWTDVTDPAPGGSDLQNVHRHTSVQFLADKLVWATDGNWRKKADGASFVEAARGEPLKVTALCTAIGNPVRSLVTTDIGMIAFTENKNSRKAPVPGEAGAGIVLLPSGGRRISVGVDTEGMGGYTCSLASRQALDGIFMSFVHHEQDPSNLACWTLREVR